MVDVTIARALHVVAVVIWIGGVAMVTTVLLPALRRGELGADPLQAFRAIEHRFSRQARAAVLLVGTTGFYTAARLDLWSGFRSAQFWWMHLMVAVWLLFTLILFVVEPIRVRRLFKGEAVGRPQVAFAWLNRAHWVLLVLSLVTIFAAVAGSQGWSVL